MCEILLEYSDVKSLCDNYQQVGLDSFIKENYITFYRAIKTLIDFPNENQNEDMQASQLIIPYLCATKNSNTYSLLESAVEKTRYRIAYNMLVNYRLGESEKIDSESLLSGMLRNLPKEIDNPRWHYIKRDQHEMFYWAETTRKLIELKPRLASIQKRLEPARALTMPSLILRFCLSFLGSLACCLCSHNSKEEKSEKKRNLHRQFLCAWAYESQNKKSTHYIYKPSLKAHAIETLKVFISEADTLDELLKIYDTHVDASYIENPKNFFSFFHPSYSVYKIDFIECAQKRALQIIEKNPSDVPMDFKLKNHHLFSEDHIKKGVKKTPILTEPQSINLAKIALQ